MPDSTAGFPPSLSQHPTPAAGPYSAVDVEGILRVPCCYVEGQEGVGALVCVPGEDAGDEAGDGGVLAQGEVHGEVQEHGVVVVDVQHTDTHQDLPGREAGQACGTCFQAPIRFLHSLGKRRVSPIQPSMERPRDKEKEVEGRRMKPETKREGTKHEGQLTAPRASLGDSRWS